MTCLCCGEQMKCVDDVNNNTTRLDWERCPKCNSFAEIEYNVHNGNIETVLWKRDYSWENQNQNRTYL